MRNNFPSDYHHHVAVDRAFMSKHLKLVAAEVRKRKFDTLVGCGMSSIPWAVRLSAYLRKPYVMVRKWGDTKCSANRLEPVVGRFGPTRRCVMVDDTVYSGQTRDWVVLELARFDALLVDIVRLDCIKVGEVGIWGGTKTIISKASDHLYGKP